jgi:HD-GYP domain-containing protein (c-di-GMP phosphodiesterase class II)
MEPAQMQELTAIIETMIDYIQSDSQDLLENVFIPGGSDVNVYALNLVNVSILSLEVGAALGYSHSQLVKLGLAAFLHDIGLKIHRGLIEQHKKLSPVEKKHMDRSPLAGAETLKRIPGELAKPVMEIVEQAHERMDGSGYPRGLKGEEISEYAQIIGLVDVYEALTHQRPYRNNKYSSNEALKIILKENQGMFNPKLTKFFLDRIGFYPRGTFVELNTKEIAQVIKQNFKMPTCPVVRVVYDADGKSVQDGREIDLSKGTRAFVTKCV